MDLLGLHQGLCFVCCVGIHRFHELAEDPESFSSAFFVPAEPEESQNEDIGHCQSIRYRHPRQARQPRSQSWVALNGCFSRGWIRLQHEGRGQKLRTGCRSCPRGVCSLTKVDGNAGIVTACSCSIIA